MKSSLYFLIIIASLFSVRGISQTSGTADLNYEVNRVFPYLSLTNNELKAATKLADLNHRYQPVWIKAFVTVEISAICEGRTRIAVGKNDILTREQKEIMNLADAGTDIAVKVHYLPNNTLTNNDIKVLDFTFTVDPAVDASYPNGQQQLYTYLQENAIAKIPAGSFVGYQLAAVKFTITEEGAIDQVELFESSKNEAIDALLLTAITKMPCWNPATAADGTKVSQEFALTVGNMENCMVNLLNIRRQR